MNTARRRSIKSILVDVVDALLVVALVYLVAFLVIGRSHGDSVAADRLAPTVTADKAEK